MIADRTLHRTLAWHEGRLSRILPTDVETALLATCLTHPTAPDAARAAWGRFTGRVVDPKRYFEMADGGVKGLLPFVEYNLRQAGIAAPASFLTYARVAVVREELRDRIYRNVFQVALRALASAGVHPLLVRGLAVADACYVVPSTRHNHAIELVVATDEIEAAVLALGGLGCKPAPEQRAVSRRLALLHPSGLPLVLHTRLFELPHLAAPMAVIRARGAIVEIEGTSVLVPCVEDQLLQICGHAGYSSTRGNLRWVCDAVQLIRAHGASIDWSQLVAAAEQFGMALPMAVMLRYLREHMASDVPQEVIAALQQANRLSEPCVREIVYAMSVEPPTRSAQTRGLARDTRSAFSFAMFRLLPSRDYMAWKYGVIGTNVLACYLSRPVHFIARRLARLLHRTSRQNSVAVEST